MPVVEDNEIEACRGVDRFDDSRTLEGETNAIGG